MNPGKIEYTLYDNVTPVAVASSTNASPTVITTSAPHGLSVGQRVLIQGHATNTAANGIFQVTAVGGATTFTIGDEVTGASVAANGAGTGGFCLPAPHVELCTDYKTIDFFIATAGGANVTLAAVGSLGIPKAEQTLPRGPYPNVGATRSYANPWSYLQLVDLNTGSAITGSTGVVVSGSDVINQYEANINESSYVAMIPIAWTSGSFSIKALLRTSL